MVRAQDNILGQVAIKCVSPSSAGGFSTETPIQHISLGVLFRLVVLNRSSGWRRCVTAENGRRFSADEKRRLEREVATLRKAHHENVCHLHESFAAEDGMLMVMVCPPPRVWSSDSLSVDGVLRTELASAQRHRRRRVSCHGAMSEAPYIR